MALDSLGGTVADDFAVTARRDFGQFAARRRTVVLVAYLGYAACYLVRNNLAIVSDIMSRELGWTAVQIGSILAGFTVSYGIGKLVIGVAVDHWRLRHAFAFGLGISALLCIVMSTLRDPIAFLVCLVLIGLVQGACAPAALATIGAWFPLRSRGNQVAIWNTSQNFGAAALALVVSGGLALVGPDDWTVGFWLPGAIALACAAIVFRFGGDRPWQEGMPTLRELYGPDEAPQRGTPAEVSYWRLVRVHVLGNRTLALLGALNALLYLVRFGILNWIPIFQIQQRSLTQHEAAVVISAFEWGAIPGALLFGWLSLRWPRRGTVIAGVGIGLLSLLVLVYAVAAGPAVAIGVALPLGALVYGPQVVVNVLTLNLVSPRAVGIAVGWVGLGGYLVGAALANLSVPLLAEATSWELSLATLSLACVICVLICVRLRRAEAPSDAT